MNAPETSLQRLMFAQPPLAQLVIVCALVESQRLGAQPLLRGLSDDAFARLCSQALNGAELENGRSTEDPLDEFADLFELLCEHAEPRDEMGTWLAAAIATAAQRDNHLWQDLGLPSRRELSAVLNLRFPRLAAANTGDMKWKKFFYRQLCQRAEVPICKSPNCADCCDHALCFGPEA